jgi:hypothetical protein
MVKIGCEVTWRVIIPHGDLIPYIIIASFGIHSHPPPPPSRIPPPILAKLVQTLDSTINRTQGLSKLLLMPY